MKRGKSFVEIAVGDSVEFEVEVNESMHLAFSQLVSDFSAIHTSEDFAAKTNFRRRIGYAFLLTAFLSTLYGEYLPGGTSVCLKQEAKFVRPYYPGDRLRIRGEVVRKLNSARLVELKSEAFRNGQEKIFEGRGVVQVFI